MKRRQEQPKVVDTTHVCKACGRRDTKHPSQICFRCTDHGPRGEDRGPEKLNPEGSKRRIAPGPQEESEE